LKAQVNTTWTDGTGNWSNPANWNNGIPNGTYGQFNAFIGNGSSPNPLANLDINANVNSLSLNSAGVLMEPGTNLTLANLALSGNNSFLTGATGNESLIFYGSTGSYSGISGPGTVSNLNLTVFAIPFFAITDGAKVSTSGAFANNGFGDDQFTLSNRSTLNVNGGFTTRCSLSISGSQMNVQGSWTMNNAEPNFVDISSGSTVNVKGDFVSCCFLASIGVGGGSVLNVDGNFDNSNNSGGDIPSGMGVGNGGTLRVGGDYTSQGIVVVNIDNGSIFRVKGNLNNLTYFLEGFGAEVPTLDLSNGSALSVGKDLTNSGIFSLTTGSVGTVHGAFNNSGSVSVDDSSVLRVKSGFDQTAGTTVIDGISWMPEDLV
jgi:hypothetical protein